MPKAGEVLQQYNKDLVGLIATLKQKESTLARTIESDEKTKVGIEKQIKDLEAKLTTLSSKLVEARLERNNLQDKMQSTEEAYTSILADSLNLLNSLREETAVSAS